MVVGFLHILKHYGAFINMATWQNERNSAYQLDQS
ncbi:unnamed protein product [Brassica rapa]|uniref:Uncharacterized protein n=1 Tax=Brassica campestris TaxID=3711 RepID=A0A8D9CZG8_BRACM|nr:unnamed protein product [Brassica rapa]